MRLLKIDINPNRAYGLDILRALAILFVVIGHGALLLPESYKAFHRWIVFDGVTIFFVLSGFLIGNILIRQLEKYQLNLKLLMHFWLRRWFRTLPNYFLILLLLIGLHQIYHPEVQLAEFKRYFLFLQNFDRPHPPYFPEAWSLSIEEWFYLITPILLFLIIRVFRLSVQNAVLLVGGGILIFSLILRWYRFHEMEISTQVQWASYFRKQVITRLDSLMLGILAAYTQKYAANFWHSRKNVMFAIGVLIFLLIKGLFLFEVINPLGSYNAIWSFFISSLATALLLPFLSLLEKGKGWIYRNISRISLISYSMYLINLSLVQGFILPVIDWEKWVTNPELIPFLNYGSFWLITIFGSVLLYKYFEIPLTSLRDNARIKGLFVRKNL